MTKYPYPYGYDGYPYTGPSIGGMLTTAFILLMPVVILALVFSYPLAW